MRDRHTVKLAAANPKGAGSMIMTIVGKINPSPSSSKSIFGTDRFLRQVSGCHQLETCSRWMHNTQCRNHYLKNPSARPSRIYLLSDRLGSGWHFSFPRRLSHAPAVQAQPIYSPKDPDPLQLIRIQTPTIRPRRDVGASLFNKYLDII